MQQQRECRCLGVYVQERIKEKAENVQPYSTSMKRSTRSSLGEHPLFYNGAAVSQPSRWIRRYMMIMFIGVLLFMMLAVPRISKDLVLTPGVPIRYRYTEPQPIMKAMLKLERHHRKMETNLFALRFLLESKLQEMTVGLSNESHAAANITNTMEKFQDIKTNLYNVGIKMKGYFRSHLQDLKAADNIVAVWRERESRELVDIVQKKIHKVMNPVNCEQRKKFFCDINRPVGFGSTLHRILYCVTLSMKYDRPLILMDESWKYGKWETVFKPISTTCRNVSIGDAPAWNGTSPGLHAKIINRRRLKIKYDPMESVPKEVAGRLSLLHRKPLVWWIGQLMKYLLRPKPDLAEFTAKVLNRTGFKLPVVGIHVRRTDRLLREAKAYDIREYMKKVDEYFDKQELTEKIEKRRVYIATDEPKVVTEARKLYPKYVILNDQMTVSGAGVKTRYSTDGLKAVVTDIEILSACDYVVCTFSSNVCRAVYEYMQAKRLDASQNCLSLDKGYYFG